MKFLKRLVSFISVLAFAAAAFAQTYPINNPTYIPTAIFAPQTFTTTGDYTYTTSGVGTVTVRVSGTCTGLTSAPQGTNDGTNWTTIQAMPVVGGANVTSITAAGFWRLNTAGFTKTRLHITALSASCTVAMAGTPSVGSLYLQGTSSGSAALAVTNQAGTNFLGVDSNGIASVKVTDGTNTMPTMDAAARPGFQKITDGTNIMPTQDAPARAGYEIVTDGTNSVTIKAASTVPLTTDTALVVAQSANGDPCQTMSVSKSSVAINIGSATTVAAVAVSGSTSIYLCGFVATAAGTSPTILFKYGTQTTNPCDTGAVNLSGTFAPTAGSTFSLSGFGGMTITKTIAAQQLCITYGGTGSPSLQGVLTYVQR